MLSKRWQAWPMLCALLCAPLLGTASAASPEHEATAAALRNRALTSDLAFRIVGGLTTRIGPRLAGSDAERRAAEWLRQQCEELGFDRVWVESFPIAEGWERGEERAEVVGHAAQPLVVTALGGSVATPPNGIEAEIALFQSYQEFLAAPESSLKGRIAVVTQRMKRARTVAGYREVNAIRSGGPSEAGRRGAVAFLMRSLGTSSDRLAHTGNTRYAADVPRIPAAALSGPDAEQLERLAADGQSVRVRLLLTPRHVGPVTSRNVIAEVRGRERPEEIILIGAHLDSWDLGTGAIDDGAGVAIVTAAAKLILDLPERPKRAIRVVLFGAEEIGLVGGRAYAEAHQAELARHVLVAEADFGQGPIYSFQTGVADPTAPSLQQIRAALAPLGIEAGNNASRGSSDVTPLFQRGVPAVTLEMDGTEYFDLHHNPNDTLDKIEMKKLNQSTAAYAVFAYLAAELDGNYRASDTVSGGAGAQTLGGAR